jgi:hypothetical protein
MKDTVITILSIFCFLAILFIQPSAIGKKATPRARTSKASVGEQNVNFQSQTNTSLRDIMDQLQTKVSKQDLKGIQDAINRAEKRADETAFEMKIVMLVGGGIVIVLGVLIKRLFARITPESGKQSLSITS